MTSSNGNIFRITDQLCGEFSLICVWINVWVNGREAGDLRRYRAHYDVRVRSHGEAIGSSIALQSENYSLADQQVKPMVSSVNQLIYLNRYMCIAVSSQRFNTESCYWGQTMGLRFYTMVN